jgi:hypothetical protein
VETPEEIVAQARRAIARAAAILAGRAPGQ